MLRSIEVWMDLGEEEALFLEGAENLDRVGLGAAVVEQVKTPRGRAELRCARPRCWTPSATPGHMRRRTAE